MPKEQGHSGERAARCTSKNAKDKSNSATLRASKNGAHSVEPGGRGDLSSRMLRCDSEKDSEKDSGYSEAGSDCVHTDVDDRRSSVSRPHRESSKSSGSSSSSSNNNSKSASAAGRNRPYEELAPVYIIKNLVVKPSRPDQLLHSSLAWGGAPTQLLLIQQPALPASSTSTPKKSSAPAAHHAPVKTGGGRHGSKNSYLPILNSYPRIAPHPRKEGHEGKSGKWVEGSKEGGGEGQSQSKRVCTEDEKREAVSTTSHLLRQQQAQKEGKGHSHSQSQHKSRGHNSFPVSPYCPLPSHGSSTGQRKSHHRPQSSSSGFDSVSSPYVSSSQTPSPPSSSNSPSSSSSSSPPSSSSPSSSAAHSPYRHAPDSSSARHRRFLNTAEILNQSGLLAITLRTKELLKQNATTEREIAQLRQHTNLLCQAAQAGPSSDSLDKLMQAMTKSASYPDLDLNQLKALSGIHQQSKPRTEEDREKENNLKTTKNHSNTVQLVSLHKIDDGTSPPSPLFAPSPNTEERQHAADPLDLMATVSFPQPDPEQSQGHRQSVMDKDLRDLTMLPESSTNNDYLL